MGRLQSAPPQLRSNGFWFATYARDWTAAKQILDKNPDEDLVIGDLTKLPIPRGCGGIWLAALQGKHPTMEEGFGAARNQLAQRVEAHLDALQLLSALGTVDAFLGRKQDAIQEATRAADLCQDALERPFILGQLFTVYAWTNEPDLAFRTLAILVETPPYPVREVFKANPEWDPLRKDPRFDKLVAQLPQYQ